MQTVDESPKHHQLGYFRVGLLLDSLVLLRLCMFRVWDHTTQTFNLIRRACAHTRYIILTVIRKRRPRSDLLNSRKNASLLPYGFGTLSRMAFPTHFYNKTAACGLTKDPPTESAAARAKAETKTTTTPTLSTTDRKPSVVVLSSCNTSDRSNKVSFPLSHR